MYNSFLKIINEQTTLLSPRNQDWKKIKVETEKILKYIPRGNLTELNELIYLRAKLVEDKIGIPQRNLDTNTKPGWEMRIEGRIKMLRQHAKLLEETHKNPTKWKDTQTTTANKSDHTAGRNKSKDIGERTKT